MHDWAGVLFPGQAALGVYERCEAGIFYSKNFINLWYEDRGSDSVLPCIVGQRDADGTDSGHDKPQVSSCPQGRSACHV